MNPEKEIPYEIGVRVTSADGDCGTLHRVIMDPTSKALTHLVVGPDEHSARLVPVSMVGSASTEAVVLICTNTELDRLEPAEATEVIQSAAGELGARGSTLGTYSPSRARSETVTYDRVPAGEVQMRRGEKVHAADGDIGRLQGLVVDRDNHITYVLLSKGHWWSKKEVAVPIEHVTDAIFGVQLDLTKGQVKDLPPVDLARLG